MRTLSLHSRSCGRIAIVGLALVLTGQTLSLHGMQLTRGFISGTVLDPSGAIVQGARVTTRSLLTNEERVLGTNEVGSFRFVAVEPGLYEMEFASPGFEIKRLTGIKIGPAEEVVLNEILSLQLATAAIEVGEATLSNGVARTTATVQRTLTGNYLDAAPLTAPFRDLTRLALLAPATVRGPSSSEISANGQRTRQNNFMIDGIDNNDLSVGGPSARLIPEAVSDIQIQIVPYSAEYGRNTGAQILALTRGGSNELRGEIWDYYRANWMEPLSLLNKRAALSDTPRFVQHHAGASGGGPIIAGRSFFFGLIEANRRREGEDARNAQTAVIPTPAGFTALETIPLGNNQSLQSRQAVLNALSFLKDVYPQVSRYENITVQSINGTAVEVGTIRIPVAKPHDAWLGLLRLDYNPSERDSITYRYLFDKLHQENVASNRQFGSRFVAGGKVFIQHHALSARQTLTPHVTNEVRFAYVRNNLEFPENDPTSPTVSISRAFTIGGLSTFPQGRVSNAFQWQVATTVQLGPHALKMGLDLSRIRLFNIAAFDSKGTWFFSSLADFLNNRASTLRQVVSDASYDARQTRQSYFFQDDFRVSSGLTVNIGGRYEHSGAPFGFFGAATPEIAAGGVPLPATSDKNNWAPRVGFAYSPNPRGGWKARLLGNQQTVVRGGFGSAYDVLFYNVLTLTANNPPRVVRFDLGKPETVNLFPRLAPKQSASVQFDPLGTFVNIPSDSQNPALHYWSFAIQRQLLLNSLIEIGYIGNRSYHLLRQGESNPAVLTEQQAAAAISGGPVPSIQERRLNGAWGSRSTIEPASLAEYHALFVRFDRRMLGGLLLGGNYTWSATFSDNDEPLAIGAIVSSSPVVPQSYFNYRNEWSRSIFDRPHRLVVHYSYEIPISRVIGRASEAWGRILGGWQVSGFSEWQSGQPFTVRTGVDSGGSGVSPSVSGWRPDLNLGGTFRRDIVEGNLRTFSTPIDGTGLFLTPLSNGLPLANSMPAGGNLGRNTFRGPSFTNWNVSIAKHIPISERLLLQVRGDFYNLWNHRNFGNPDAVMSNVALGTFGTNATDPGTRTMLLALKAHF